MLCDVCEVCDVCDVSICDVWICNLPSKIITTSRASAIHGDMGDMAPFQCPSLSSICTVSFFLSFQNWTSIGVSFILMVLISKVIMYVIVPPWSRMLWYVLCKFTHKLDETWLGQKIKKHSSNEATVTSIYCSGISWNVMTVSKSSIKFPVEHNWPCNEA